MPATSPEESDKSGEMHFGNVGRNVVQKAGRDIIGRDKIKNIYISADVVTQYSLITASPYRGLERFKHGDTELFFGRDQLIESLLAKVSTSNILLVVGASGSGKSSVVRAGLLPRLKAPPGSRYRSFTLVPDANPFESLRNALQAGGFSQAQTRELLDAQPDTPIRLIHALQDKGEKWFIFVDQFEEIFTVSEEPLCKSFIAALLKIAQDTAISTYEASSINLVLAMRADFFDRFSPFSQFAKLIEKNIALVADMHADELRLAIEQPAARHGVIFEQKQGLVEEIIKDVQDQAGSLPLLQYTLDLLWKKEYENDGLVGRHLRAQTYRELGGVRGTLQKRANEIYGSFGDGADAKVASPNQEIVRQIFLRLVDITGTSSDNGAWRPVRRRTPRASFTTQQEQEVLDKLIDEKLVVSNREGKEATVEVAHEALFTAWGGGNEPGKERLKEWIEGGRRVVFARNRLADDMRRWQDGTNPDDLLSGFRLKEALEMRRRGEFLTVGSDLTSDENAFLDSSLARREKWEHEAEERAKEKEEARQKELEDAKKIARISAQADFELAKLYPKQEEFMDPRTLAHLARALRTQPDASLPQQYLVSLLRDMRCGDTRIQNAEGRDRTITRRSSWAVAVNTDAPLPAWVPELAETLGALRFNEEGLLVAPKKSIGELAKELLALKGDDFWSRLGRWFFTPGPDWTISPDSRMTVAELERFCFPRWLASGEKSHTLPPQP